MENHFPVRLYPPHLSSCRWGAICCTLNITYKVDKRKYNSMHLWATWGILCHLGPFRDDSKKGLVSTCSHSMLVEEDVCTSVCSRCWYQCPNRDDMLFLMFIIWSWEGIHHLQGFKGSPFSKYVTTQISTFKSILDFFQNLGQTLF